MANNPTPNRLEELIAAGEDLCDGLNQHGAVLSIKQNTLAAVRADLDALIAAINAASAAKGAQPAAYTALRTADSNAKGYIARAIKVLTPGTRGRSSTGCCPNGCALSVADGVLRGKSDK